jgi:hypothetical protein
LLTKTIIRADLFHSFNGQAGDVRKMAGIAAGQHQSIASEQMTHSTKKSSIARDFHPPFQSCL